MNKMQQKKNQFLLQTSQVWKHFQRYGKVVDIVLVKDAQGILAEHKDSAVLDQFQSRAEPLDNFNQIPSKLTLVQEPASYGFKLHC
jgi:hypothetical protein